jgi:NSS family neurotransmitter:Na+ symporter
MMIEIGLGRKTQLSPIAGMAKLCRSRSNPWNLVAWMGVTAAVAVNAYYMMLIGWIVGYFVMTMTGSLSGQSADQLQSTFTAFTTTAGPLLTYTLLSIVVMTLIVRRGLGSGLERLARIAMPLLFVLLVALAVRSLTLPGAMEGVKWFLTPDFSQINAGTVLAALGQAFFSLGVGMAAGFAFGSYMHPRDSDVPGNVAIVVACDTAVAVLAGLVIFPALFAFGIAPDAGPGLIFVTMPQLFEQMPGGLFFGATFFFLLLLAGITSAVAIFEVIAASLIDGYGISRTKAAVATGSLWAVLSTLVILGEGPWSALQLFGLTLFGLLDVASTNFLLPAGGLALALYTVFVWKFDGFRDDVNVGAGGLRITGLLRPAVLFVIPVGVILVLLTSLGLIE